MTLRNRNWAWLIVAAFLLEATQQLAPAGQPYAPVCQDPMLEPWRWRSFPEVSGMGLQCMAEGKDGKMWFGTADGASSYDGIEWTSYTARDGLATGVDTLCSGPAGTLYAGGVSGLYQFDHQHWNRLLPGPGQSFGSIKRLTVGHDGTLWAATSWGLLCHKDKEWVLWTGPEGVAAMDRNQMSVPVRVETFPDSVLAKPRGNEAQPNRSDICEVHEDRQGRIWLGTEDGEVLCYTPTNLASAPSNTAPASTQTWVLYNEADGLMLSHGPRILQVADGTVWVVNYGSRGRANFFDGNKWRNLRLQDHGASDDCSSLLQTRDGVFWVGCNGAVAANRNGQWQVYEAPKVPIPTVHTLLFQSSDGALWIAGQDAEVLRLEYQTQRWTSYADLNFQWESPKGNEWFLHLDGRVVEHEGDRWTIYGPEDGLIDSPTSIIGSRDGTIWVSGSHDHTAATARFDGKKWERMVHQDLSWGVDWRAVLESSDGSLWFGAAVDSSGLGKKYQDGLMQYRNGVWTHHQFSNLANSPIATNSPRMLDASRSPAGKFYGLGESRDGKIWGGQGVIVFYDGSTWQILRQDNHFQIGVVEAMFTSKERDLWIGSRQLGVFRYDGTAWQRYSTKDGLPANTIRSITQTVDGSLWVATDRGVSRFDGRQWTSDALPVAFNMARESGSLKAAPSGGLWINRLSRNWTRRAWPKSPALDLSSIEFWTVRLQMNHRPPHTMLTLGDSKVPQPGNLTIAWKGTDPWRLTTESRLQYSYRMDAGQWSPYGNDQTHSFFALHSGPHRFEVRARDEDFNVDPNPAVLEFIVLPPVWKQAWFVGLMVLLIGATGMQTLRVFQNGRHLRRTNAALAAEVEERKRVQAQAEETHKQLLQASHQAGMAEVATSVLHNVGNVLNSVNVSADCVTEHLRNSRSSGLAKVAELLEQRGQEPNFLTTDEKGRQVPGYLKQLTEHMTHEREVALKELGSLRENINHIKDIIAMQQQYSRLAGFTESVKVTDLVEDALRLNEGALTRHNVHLVRDFQEKGTVTVAKHKVLQILVNLIRNAKYACDDSGKSDRELTIRTLRNSAQRVRIEVRDNGIGIPAENLTKIFGQGFTTRKNGHGFGLHSAANAAAELGGTLMVHSAGIGEGATFTLELPVNPSESACTEPKPAGDNTSFLRRNPNSSPACPGV